ncbi:MAG: molybdopterin-dependent oxidoreductase [Chloroflexi bacterium]|nr:molybdopterin-dependent oxidoreductase [Chloroflexota bacterium]
MAIESSRQMRLSFTVNGMPRELETEPDRTLLRVLRDDLGLTGTKEGCDGGECGACTVLVDGRAAMSCLLPASRVQGRQVTTIEGLGTPEALHPIQEAFVQKGAVQCGFCTPGMIMTTKALMDANPNPSREDIVRRLSRNLCRCTGYVKIIEAVEYAAHLLRGGARVAPPAGDGPVGMRLPRRDAGDKVTGVAKYTADLKMERMLHGKVLGSPHHHALIRAIDTKEAMALPGVAAVVTARDIPGQNSLNWRGEPMGEPLLAEEKVLYVGQPVALVAAATPELAARAASLIKVEYQPLEPIMDPVAAAHEGCPQIHPMGDIDPVRQVVRGDVAVGFAQAEVIVENTYRTPFQEHAYLEPDAALAHMDEEGRMIVRTCTMFPHPTRLAVASLLNLHPEKVRVIQMTIGGGFGGKYVEHCWLMAPLLAHKAGRPVKLVYSRQEVMLATKKRHPFVMTYRTGATRDGHLVALEARLIDNHGAYMGFSPGLIYPETMYAATGPYYWPNVHIHAQAVCTNAPKTGAMRGLGGIQVAFAIESQMDLMAHKLGIDPVEFRLKNALQVGSTLHTGQVLTESVGIKQTLELVKESYRKAKEEKKTPATSSPVRRGVGVASGWRLMGGTALMPGRVDIPVPIYVELLRDGRVEVTVGISEVGQGTETALAQMAAQGLGVPLESILITLGDTDVTPHYNTTAMKGTYDHGQSIQDGVRQLKAVLTRAAAQVLEEGEENLRMEKGFLFSSRDPSQTVSLAHMAAVLEGKGVSRRYVGKSQPRPFIPLDPKTGQGLYAYIFLYNTQVAQVAVNTATGEVKVERIVSASDAGTIINPTLAEGQVEGSILTGLGFALKEDFIPGRTRSFKDYPIPTIKDMPQIVNLFVGEAAPSASFGAKGVGETGTFATAPAIANAIANATGARVYQLPALPQRVLQALESARRA